MKPNKIIISLLLTSATLTFNDLNTSLESKFNIYKKDLESKLSTIYSNIRDSLQINTIKTPKLMLRKPEDFFNPYTRDSVEILATYNPETNEIFLSSKYAESLDSLKKIDLYTTKSVSHYSFDLVKDIPKLFAHESGHFLFNQLATNNGFNTYWPNYNEIDPQHLIGLRLISEGLAEYAERLLYPSANTFADSLYSKRIEDFDNLRTISDGGYNLIAPVFREYGNRGALHMMRNPPSNKDLKNLPAYRRRIISQLKKSSIKS